MNTPYSSHIPRSASAHDLLTMQIRTLPLNSRLAALFGNIPANAPFSGVVWGNAGSAKSTLALEFAMELGRFGTILYNTSEEHFSVGTIQQRLRFLPVLSPRVTFLENRSLEELMNALATRKPLAVVVDSVSEMDAEQEEVIGLIDEFPDTSFVFVAQATANDRKPLGRNALRHKVDFVIKCERRGGSRIAINEKNRLAPTAQEMVIFEVN
ncbi:MAG: hypothetical protein EAZ92_15015 [Candidatus Kapaibacterium sp.]|nr:MAG: hypothetical protein EAZ92_15015 [Candidatus Kapabacteria bacterium]